MTWRALRDDETDHESLWLSVSVAASVVGTCWVGSGLPTPVCWFHLTTGLPCPTCGVTRAARQLLHGDLPGAFRYNPLGVCALGAMIAFDIYAAIVLTFKLPRFRVDYLHPKTARWLRIIVCAALLINWGWLIGTGV